MPDAPAVSVTNLTKTYRSGLVRRESVRALDGVTLSVPPGTIFGLLGPNGAGKSTMVKILLDVVHASSGKLPSSAFRRRRPRRESGWAICRRTTNFRDS